jgi:RNA polymerase sigma-70 factor (ECF subfamily)
LTQQEFKVLFENHFAEVRKAVFYRSGDADVATDIAQETFLKIWEKHNSIQLEKVKGLLFKIANDLYISHHRKEKRSFKFFSNYVFDSESQSPEEEMAFNQLKDSYSTALEKMNEKQRTVFLLSRAENLKYTEIAEMLGISLKAVEKRMTNALGHLRNLLKQ